MKKNLIQRSMPIFEGKKIHNIGIKVNKQQQDELQKICDELDRPMSYVVRELAMRGLASYYRDGFIRMTAEEESAILRTMPIDAEIVEPSKDEIRAQLGFNVKNLQAAKAEKTETTKTEQDASKKTITTITPKIGTDELAGKKGIKRGGRVK